MSKIHLFINGERVACQDIPYNSCATLNPVLVTCERCKRTKVYSVCVKAYANRRRNSRKQEFIQKELFENE